MRRRARLFLLPLAGAAGLVVLVVLASIVWLAALRAADPLDSLRRDPGAIRVVADSSYPATSPTGERRVFRDLTLATDGAGLIRVTTSRPAELTDARLPLVLILAGLRTGRESLGVVPWHGPNLLVGYQYPYDQETWYRSARATQIPVIRRAAHDVPWQVAYVAERLRREPHVDSERSALLGYSFGALFVPAAQRLATEAGRGFDAAILAFGGVDIQGLMEANLDIESRVLRRAAGWVLASLLHPLDPAHHLPHVRGRFLVIRGADDDQIPEALSRRLAELTPEPRDVVTLEGGHMNPRNPELTRRVVRISQDWLIRQGVVEPATLDAGPGGAPL